MRIAITALAIFTALVVIPIIVGKFIKHGRGGDDTLITISPRYVGESLFDRKDSKL